MYRKASVDWRHAKRKVWHPAKIIHLWLPVRKPVRMRLHGTVGLRQAVTFTTSTATAMD